MSVKKTYDFSPVNSWMESYVNKGHFLGSSILVALENNIIHKHFCGFRDGANTKPFDFNTVIRIYSMTKPITALAIMILYDQKKLDINSPISEFIPAYSNPTALIENASSINQIRKVSPPTLIQLLTHTSGLSYSFNDNLIGRAYGEAIKAREKSTLSDDNLKDGKYKVNLEILCDELAKFPLSFSPGTKWEYSMGIDVIGRVIEIVSGRPLDKFLKENIFEPAEMDHTSFYFKEKMINRFAECLIHPDHEQRYNHYLDHPSDYKEENVKLFLGGSGLLSTISDYFQFTQIIMNNGTYLKNRIISSEGIQKLTTNVLTSDIASMGPKHFAHMPTLGMGHGLGGSVIIEPQKEFSSSVGDFSWGGMASTYFWIDRVEKLTTIFFTQLIPSNAYPNRPELKNLVRKVLDL